MNEMRNDADGTSKEQPVRKAYHRPTLEVHGTIREVTEHVGNLGTHPDPPPHAGGNATTR